MFKSEDWDIYRNVTGSDIVSPEFMEEYQVRLRIQHRAGRTGPLGVDGMVCLFRQFDIAPGDGLKKEPDKTDWRKVATGTKVFANVNGVKKLGVYCGQVGSGTLAVQAHGEEKVYELPAMRVSLAPPSIKDVPDKDLVPVKAVRKKARNAT